MPIRSKVFFGGLEVQVSCTMSRSQGVSPDIGTLVWRVGSTLPSSSVGDLVFTNGDTIIVTMRDCALRNPTEKYGGVRSMQYQVLDRRWKWKTPTVFHSWNARDEKKLLIPGYEKNVRELASMLLDALGETGYDVSALPTDPELAPTVEWHYTPAAVELDKLCALFGCSVNLMNDNTVLITVDNVGAIPDDTGLMHPVEQGLIVNPAPDFITVYASSTMFDSWLTLEEIGRDEEGLYVPINMLSYTPAGGWEKNGDPNTGYDTEMRGPLKADNVPAERIDKMVELADRTVFRLFRVTGFPSGQKFFPGFTLEASVGSVGSLPQTGEGSKVYVIANQHTVIWDGTTYVGVTWYNTSESYKLIDPLLIGNPYGTSPMVLGTGTRTEMIAAQTAAGIASYTVIAPGCAAVDPRILLPLMESRVENTLDENQLNTKRSAEVCGLFRETDRRLRNKGSQELTMWKHGISIDAKRGHVILGQPAYVNLSTGIDRPTMYLRCGYGYRLTAYGSRYHRNYSLATGNTLGIANGTVSRQDISEYRVQNYGSDYNDLSIIDETNTNTAEVDAILLNTATENLKQYQNFEAPRQKPYTPFRAVDTNGNVHQVSYKGVLSVATTTVSIGGSFDTSQPPAKLKRIQELQRRQSEGALQNFRASTIDAALNQNATGGALGIAFTGQDIA